MQNNCQPPKRQVIGLNKPPLIARNVPGRVVTAPTLDMSVNQCSPLLKKHSIPVTIARYFTDVDGAIVNKAGLPDALKVAYPFYVLGAFDMRGGYAAGLRQVPPTPGTFYLMSFIEGFSLTSQQITQFSGLNTVRTRMKVGDIVHVFTDNLDAPTYFIWVVQSSRNGSLASIIENTAGAQRDMKIGPMGIEHYQYSTDNPDEQWGQTIQYIRSSNIGTFAADQINPYTFKTSNTEQDGFIRIKTPMMELTPYQSVATYFLFNTESIQFNFLITE